MIFDDIDKENLDYAYKVLEKVNEKDSIRIQICEVENILRLLRMEVEQTASQA